MLHERAAAADGGDRDRVPAIRCAGVSKQYGSAVVVDRVDLAVRAGEVHALVGANGAGKSTLLGMLSGRTPVTAGEIEVFGSPLRSGSPRRSRANGIATVYQELTVIPQLTACANVFLGDEQHRAGWLSQKQMEQRFRALCGEFGIDIPPGMLAERLPVATRQVLEIMRAIHSQARVVLLDEPTAALSQAERDMLLRLIGQLSARGVTIMLVSHNLGEVLSVSDTVSVLRGGRLVRTAPGADWTRADLIHAMTGEVVVPALRDARPELGDTVLRATGVTVPGAIEDVSVSVRAGEIVGLAGLVGAGRTTLLRALAGAEPHSTGTIERNGQPRRWPRTVREALRRLDIALVPEERKLEGLHLHLGVPDNVTLSRLADFSRAGVVSPGRQLKRSKQLLAELQVSRPVGNYPVGELSGGNQQKVAVAKWLHRGPQVLLIDEPTRGVDVVARVQLMAAIRRYARAGNAVIMTSSEVEEVLELADRMIVLSLGHLVAEVDLHERLPSVREVLELSFERTG